MIFGGGGGPGGFIRGDTNADGRVNLTDAVALLEYLFDGGGTMPRCLDALDTNDSGSIDLTDAVIVLNFLFTGGPAPTLPYPEPGLDATPDGLRCLGQ